MGLVCSWECVKIEGLPPNITFCRLSFTSLFFLWNVKNMFIFFIQPPFQNLKENFTHNWKFIIIYSTPCWWKVRWRFIVYKTSFLAAFSSTTEVDRFALKGFLFFKWHEMSPYSSSCTIQVSRRHKILKWFEKRLLTHMQSGLCTYFRRGVRYCF